VVKGVGLARSEFKNHQPPLSPPSSDPRTNTALEILDANLNTQTDADHRDLINQRRAYDTEATRRAALVGYIAEQQAKGLSYDDAWARAKVERAEIFSNMHRS
jgi:hypothetical protein